jgi:hypothetical protein
MRKEKGSYSSSFYSGRKKTFALAFCGAAVTSLTHGVQAATTAESCVYFLKEAKCSSDYSTEATCDGFNTGCSWDKFDNKCYLTDAEYDLYGATTELTAAEISSGETLNVACKLLADATTCAADPKCVWETTACIGSLAGAKTIVTDNDVKATEFAAELRCRGLYSTMGTCDADSQCSWYMTSPAAYCESDVNTDAALTAICSSTFKLNVIAGLFSATLVALTLA